MPQPGFFDLDETYSKLDGIGDPLRRISDLVAWEAFRSVLDEALTKPRKSNAGRKEYDRVLMFKVLVLQQLYNLSDDQTEFQIRDRHSFRRFLVLNQEDRVPDAKTIWRFRERLRLAGAVEKLFDQFSAAVETQGYRARKGQIVDASIVKAPRQHNTRKENAQVKAGETPAGWSKRKRRHKDVDARWTSKHGAWHYGYKNHISVDKDYGLVRRYAVTDAAVHDSQVFEEVLDETNTNGDVWADSAYQSKEHEDMLKKGGYRSRVHRKGQRNHPLPRRSLEANRKKSKVRARVEHVFAHQEAMGGKLVRTVGLERATCKIGLTNLVFNMRRFAWLCERRPVTCLQAA